MRTIDGAARVGVPVGGVEDGAAAELDGLLHGHVRAVASVQDTVRKGGARADGEALSLQPGAVAVNVEEAGSLNTSMSRVTGWRMVVQTCPSP